MKEWCAIQYAPVRERATDYDPCDTCHPCTHVIGYCVAPPLGTLFAAL